MKKEEPKPIFVKKYVGDRVERRWFLIPTAIAIVAAINLSILGLLVFSSIALFTYYLCLKQNTIEVICFNHWCVGCGKHLGKYEIYEDPNPCERCNSEESTQYEPEGK